MQDLSGVGPGQERMVRQSEAIGIRQSTGVESGSEQHEVHGGGSFVTTGNAGTLLGTRVDEVQSVDSTITNEQTRHYSLLPDNQSLHSC